MSRSLILLEQTQADSVSIHTDGSVTYHKDGVAISWDDTATPEQKAGLELAAAKASAEAQLVAWSGAVTTAITGPVPLAEMLSWTAKEQAARAVLAGSASAQDARLIVIEANVSKADPADLATRIVANADAYRDAIAALTGLRITALDAVRLARTLEGVAAAIAAAQAGWDAIAKI